MAWPFPESHDPVCHSGDNAGIHHRVFQAVVDEDLLFRVACKPDTVGGGPHRGLIGREDLIGVGATVISDVKTGMGLPVAFLLIVQKPAKHGAVIHAVAIDDGVEIHQIRAALLLHKDGAHHAAAFAPGVVQVIVRPRGGLEHGIVDLGVRHGDPADQFLVLFIEVLQLRQDGGD